MSQVLQYTLVLFGPRKGQTININGHQFFNGVCHEIVPTESAAALLRVMSYYGAFAKGTSEYDVAVRNERALTETSHGADEVFEGSDLGQSDAVSDGGEPAGAGPSETPADEFSGTDDVKAGDTGTYTDGDRLSDSGVPKFEDFVAEPEPVEPSSVGSETIHAAVRKLDPENDDHWAKRGVHAGKPMLNVIEEIMGKAGVTRADVEAAAPGWDREKAKKAKAQTG